MNPPHFHIDIVIPGRPFALESQVRLDGVGFVRTNQVQYDLLEQREVLRRILLADHAVVLADADVEHPVKLSAAETNARFRKLFRLSASGRI